MFSAHKRILVFGLGMACWVGVWAVSPVYAQRILSEYALEDITLIPGVEHGNRTYGALNMHGVQWRLSAMTHYRKHALRQSMAGGTQVLIIHQFVEHVGLVVAPFSFLAAEIEWPLMIYQSRRIFATGGLTRERGILDLRWGIPVSILKKSETGVDLALIPMGWLPLGDSTRHMGEGGHRWGGVVALGFEPVQGWRLGMNGGALFRSGVMLARPRGQERHRGWASVYTSLNLQRMFYVKADYQWAQSLSPWRPAGASQRLVGGLDYVFEDSGWVAHANVAFPMARQLDDAEYEVAMGLSWTFPSKKQPEPPKPDLIRSIEGVVVHFDHDKYVLRPDAQEILLELARVLKLHPEVEAIVLKGHTDWNGADRYNDTLSINRCKSVAHFLISQGVDDSRILLYGFGEARHIATNFTSEGRFLNRRVEVRVFLKRR
jgi:outer membrane protein OmpA-like peptidoglycan-associated protein